MTNKLTTILLTAIIVFAVGCNNAPAPETDSGKTEAADKAKATEITEDEVKTALELLRASVEKNDSEAMDKIYADDYVLVNPEGKAETRAERMEIVKAGKIKYEKVDFNDPKIRIYGNTAVVVTGATGKANMDGKDTELDMTATIIFVKTKDGVKEVSAHLTNKAKAE